MAQCVAETAAGVYQIVTGPCPSGLYVASMAELGPFALSIDDAVQIGQAMAFAWAVAFGFRLLAKLLWAHMLDSGGGE